MSEMDLSAAERKRLWIEISTISEEEFDRQMAENKARQSKLPGIGATAPDFELEVHDAGGNATGERVRLSALHGRPVALAFGSYT
jgi:hypothetical protein